MSSTIRMFEAFAGYGGASFALKRANIPYEVAGFSEIDKFAIQIYQANHKDVQCFGDITQIDPNTIPDFDLFTGGFPCQPFSQVGLGKGEGDTRGTLFHDILRICSVKKPQHILLENVKGLVTKKHVNTLNTILSSLRNLGYSVTYVVLNSKDYGIPQNRERVWIYAYLGNLPVDFSLVPEKCPLYTSFKDILDSDPDPRLFKSEDQIKRLIEHYKVDLNVSEPSCVDLYNRNVRKDGISITVLEPHHNKMRIAHPPVEGKFIVRNYSVDEHYRLMGFKEGELDYAGQSYSQLCKRAANGWDINIASKIMSQIFKV